MRDARAFYLAALLAILFTAALTIGAEALPAVKGWLKSAFGHHWVGKSALATAFFAAVSAAAYCTRALDPIVMRWDAGRWGVWVALAAALSALTLLAFFALHSFL